VRHRGTLGGSVANNDPNADYPAACLGLGATIITTKRKIPADEFFKGLFETALEPDEIITKVSFPLAKKAAYQKFRNPASRFALVGVFVADFGGGNVRVAVTGAGACAFRQSDMEKALAQKFAPESVAGIKVKPDGLNNDLHASPEYRAHLITVMAKRAVEAAVK
jgi:carbon-monoxide dehydrogenase medium subunit